jgi:hypothetical protein
MATCGLMEINLDAGGWHKIDRKAIPSYNNNIYRAWNFSPNDIYNPQTIIKGFFFQEGL